MESELIYTIHLEPADEGGYTVTVPAMPAIVTEAESYEDALAVAEEAILLYIEHCIVQGREFPIEGPRPVPLHAQVRIKAPATR